MRFSGTRFVGRLNSGDGAHIFDSAESFQAAFAAHAAALMADVPNYTDVSPVILVSEDQRVG
jgi:hypothetical protein